MMSRLLISFCLLIAAMWSCVESKGAKQAAGESPIGVSMPRVVIATNLGQIVVELDDVKAPLTVAHFLNHVKNKRYDGTLFHRVIEDFMIQGGGVKMDGDKMIELPSGQSVKNESQNGLLNRRGTIAMARKKDPDSATGQFFINVADNASLDYPSLGGYTVFGRVVEGMEIVDRIRSVRTGSSMIWMAVSESGPLQAASAQNIPIDPVVIQSIRKGSTR